MSNAVHKGDVKLLFIPCLPDPSQGCPSCCLAALIVKLPFFVQWKLTPCNFHQQAIFLASGSTENTFFWFSIPLDNFSPCPTASNIWKGLSCLLFFRLNISRSCDMVSGCLSILFITFLDWDPVSLKNVCFLKADYWLSLPHWKFLKTWTVGWRVWVSHLRVFIFLDFPLCSHTFIHSFNRGLFSACCEPDAWVLGSNSAQKVNKEWLFSMLKQLNVFRNYFLLLFSICGDSELCFKSFFF